MPPVVQSRSAGRWEVIRPIVDLDLCSAGNADQDSRRNAWCCVGVDTTLLAHPQHDTTGRPNRRERNLAGGASPVERSPATPLAQQVKAATLDVFIRAC